MTALLWLAVGLAFLGWSAELGAAGAPTVVTLGAFCVGLGCAVPQTLLAIWRDWR